MGDNALESYLRGLPPRDPAKAPAAIVRYRAASALVFRVLMGVGAALAVAVGAGVGSSGSDRVMGIIFFSLVFFLPFFVMDRRARRALDESFFKARSFTVMLVEEVNGIGAKRRPVLLTRVRAQNHGSEFWVATPRGSPTGLVYGTPALAVPTRLGAMVVSGDSLLDARRHVPGRPVENNQ